MWISTPARRRLLDHEIELTDEFDPDCQLLLVSTRGAAAQYHLVEPFLEANIPVVVVAHPGGEQNATDLIAAGATTVIAEGREASALDLLRNQTTDRLVRSFQLYLDGGSGLAGSQSVDPVTNLPTRSKFERSLASATTDGAIPRLGFIEIGPPETVNRLAQATMIGIRRRFATTAAEFITHHEGSLFDLGEGQLAFIVPELDIPATGWLCRELIDMARSFSSEEGAVSVWIGSAGPESTVDADSLVAMARKSLDAARKRESGYMDGDELARDASASVELDAALSAAAAVDGNDPSGDHSARVSELASTLASELGFEEFDVAKITLAAKLHDIGKLRYGAAAFTEDEEQHEAARVDHPTAGASYVSLIAGEDVAEMIRGHHERWDGTGWPNRLLENDIPVGARIIAIADHYDHLTSDGKNADEIAEALQAESGAMFDPNLVRALLDSV